MDYCVCCGGYVPEGRMVCAACWKRYMEDVEALSGGQEGDALLLNDGEAEPKSGKPDAKRKIMKKSSKNIP